MEVGRGGGEVRKVAYIPKINNVLVGFLADK